MSQDSSLNIKSLFNSPKCNLVKDFLSHISEENIYNICQTATSGKVKPENSKEAIEAILLFTQDLDRFFSYRRIKSSDLLYYIRRNGVSCPEKSTKLQLISVLEKFWDEKSVESNYNPNDTQTSLVSLQSEAQEKESISAIAGKSTDQSFRDSSSNQIQTVRSDIFAKEFATWFYLNLNSVLDTQQQTCRFDESLFCNNSKCSIFLVSLNSTEEVHGQDSDNCAEVFKSTVRAHNLLFSPNTRTGTIAKESLHGIVQIFACGTLHVENNFLGIFEQEFGLVKNPTLRSWQILYTNLNLKSGIKEEPSLPPVPIYEIDNK